MSPEIIEILDDNTDVFGDRAPNATLVDPGGPRWVAPAAAAALIALIGYGVATSASSTSLPKAVPAPSTIPRISATTAPAPTTTLPAAPPVPYYDADPPREFTIDSAEMQSVLTRGSTGSYQLWATDGSSSSSGSWFAIQVNPTASVYAMNAVRIETDQQSIAISHTPTGQSIAQFTATDGTDITVTSFGWSDDDLVRLAGSITYHEEEIEISDASLTVGYQMLSSVVPWLAIQGIPLEHVSYHSNADVTGGIQISVSPLLPGDLGGSTLDRQIAIRFFLADAIPFDVDGQDAVAGAVVGQDDYAAATWIAGNHAVSVTANLPVPQLIDIAQTVHPVTEEEWNGMKFQAARHNADNAFGNFEQTPTTAISSGTDGTGTPWTITVSVMSFANQQQLVWGWAGNQRVGSTADATAQITTVVHHQLTYVLADLPKAITIDGQPADHARRPRPRRGAVHRRHRGLRSHLRRLCVQRAEPVHGTDHRGRRGRAGKLAAVMSTEAPPEIIEIIDEGPDPFGDRTATITIDDSGGPRWAGPVAGAVLIALIGWGVVTSATSSSIPKAAPVTSTTRAPTTTQPVTTTTEPQPVVPYYAADPPRQFTVQFAEFTDPNRSFFDTTSYQLWATDGATATSGSWFSVESYRGDTSMELTPEARRVQSGQQSIAISHPTSGQSLAQFSIDRFTQVKLTSFGLSDDELVALTTSVTSQGDGVEVDDAAVVDYRMISTVQPWMAVEGNPAEQVYYSTNDPFGSGFSLSISPRPAPGDGDTLDRQIALRFLLDHATPFDVDGHPAVAGAVAADPGQAVATWVAGDHIVTANANMTVSELIKIARTVHQVSSEEWNGMKFQASRRSDRNVVTNVDQSTPVPVSFGTDGAAEPWTVEVVVQTFADQHFILWQWDTNSIGSPGDTSTATISTAVDDRRTYVLASLPRTVAATAQLQVSRDGFDPVSVPFNDIGADLDSTFAAYVFSEATPYTAQVVGADGEVLAAWPSS